MRFSAFLSKVVLTMCVLAASLAMAGVSGADDLFKATMTGDQEVPPVITETSGKAFFSLSKDQTAMEFQLHVGDGVRITQSHIHCGRPGVNGPIIIFLGGLHAAGLNIDGKWVSNATITDTSIVNTTCGSTLAAIAEQMRNGNTYANVHSVAHPGGEIRGLIEPTGN
jgi:CHRD domain